MNRASEIAGHADYSEKMIEAYLIYETSKLGGIALKYSNPTLVGYPDRLVILPGKPSAWVELKSRGKKPKRIQTLRHESLRRLGQLVFVCSSKEQVDEALKQIQEQ